MGQLSGSASRSIRTHFCEPACGARKKQRAKVTLEPKQTCTEVIHPLVWGNVLFRTVFVYVCVCANHTNPVLPAKSARADDGDDDDEWKVMTVLTIMMALMMLTMVKAMTLNNHK